MNPGAPNAPGNCEGRRADVSERPATRSLLSAIREPDISLFAAHEVRSSKCGIAPNIPPFVCLVTLRKPPREPSSRDRSGNDLDEEFPLRRIGKAARQRPARVFSILSATGMGRARSADDLARRSPDRARGHRKSHAPVAAMGIANQRETTVVWDARGRHANPSRHRLAGPTHRRGMRAAAAGRRRGAGSRPHGLAPRSLFLGDQACLDSGSRGGREGARGTAANSPSAPSTVSCSGT